MNSEINLDQQVKGFADRNLWEGGYYEGDPANWTAKSSYGQAGYLSALHATYLVAIKPYIRPETIALEIGPGRGAWSRLMLDAKELWALDALSAEHNKFYDYVGNHDHVHYHQVDDFECTDLPDNHFDYVFSFGCLCHVPFEGTASYAKNLWPKLKPGAECFWLVADYEKFNRCIETTRELSVYTALAAKQKDHAFHMQLLETGLREKEALKIQHRDLDEESTEWRAGRWFHAGTGRTCEMLTDLGYEIRDSDIGTTPRDPIIHFRRPL